MTAEPATVFDADNHYYEALDAFTRHVEPAFRRRCMQWVELDGRTRLLVGGRINRFIPNPTFDPVARPGSLDDYFRGRRPRPTSPAELFGDLEPIRPEYRDRDARIDVMDTQGIAGAFLFPTLAVGMELALREDPPAALAAFRAFNRWLEEDWGFAFRERLFAVPYLTLIDADRAVEELEWALDRDARAIVMCPGPVLTDGGGRSPADRSFDRFWGLANEAGITVAYHGADTLYSRYLADWGEIDSIESFQLPVMAALVSPVAIADTLAALIAGGIFARFPNVRVASVENGSEWVAPLFSRLEKAYAQTPDAFSENPASTFRRNIWVTPYYEDDLAGLARLIGEERLLFGSDWPHAEGLADPVVDFVRDLESAGFDADARARIMTVNGRSLASRAPVLT
ncbi:MAG: hypothetical protein JWL73_475 [Actinomycetia bacterium]|nr:hypothetical protein [Actinomycetes bacterium]